jgi:hypothetical protein
VQVVGHDFPFVFESGQVGKFSQKKTTSSRNIYALLASIPGASVLVNDPFSALEPRSGFSFLAYAGSSTARGGRGDVPQAQLTRHL